MGKTLFVVAAAAVLCCEATASAKPTGQAIMDAVENRNDGRTEVATVSLAIQPKHGTKRYRRFIAARKEYPKHTKFAAYILAPQGLRDAAFMVWDVRKDDDRRWLYLPAIGQVRRLAPGDARASFFGSDFVYEDFTNRDPELDRHKLLGSDKFGKWDCWVVESKPKNPGSVKFTKIRTWVWKDTPLIMREEYYNAQGKVYRRGQVLAVKKIQGIWTWYQGTMWNLASGSQTRMEISDVRYNVEIPDERFSERQLERGAPSL
ncbi:MAG TPA: outer membrane lipoprotein-sorting protein [Kofleriaceae bacterium]|nr:outer membrane lipoprotein-sorting protein [Kofleriaceae bacterium]